MIKKQYKIGLRNYLCLCLLLIFTGLPGCGIPSAPITSTSGNLDLARLLETQRVKASQPALAAAVIFDGRLLAAAAVGTRKQPTDNWVTVDDRFMIASCGKTFTATLAALMVEEGSLKWNTTLREVFPESQMRPEYESINLEQLLSHRAGLSKSFLANLDEEKNFTSTAARLVYLKQISQTELINPPGSSILYSNAGYMLAGAMMERVSGQTFYNLISAKVFKPSGLASAGYGPPALYSPTNQPWGHYWDKKLRDLIAVRKDEPHWTDPSGNISLSVKDWAKFIIEHIPKGQTTERGLLTRQSIEKLNTPADNLQWAYNKEQLTEWNKGLGWPLVSANYALGWFVTKSDDGRICLNHSGTSRAFQAEVYLSPTQKSAILLVTNSRLGHIHLYQTAQILNDTYSLKIDLP